MRERDRRRVVAAVLAALLAAAIAVTTPWHPLPGGDGRADPALDFTRSQTARSHAFNTALNPPVYAGLAVGLAFVLLLGLTPLGARLLGVATRPLRRRPLQVIGAAFVLWALMRLAGLPFDMWSETVTRRYGLSTESWAVWFGTSSPRSA